MIHVIPNGPLSNETVTNYSSQSKRRIDLTFSVSYNSDVEKVKEILMNELQKEELVLKDENGKAYAYRDAAGNYYEMNFGLRY